MRWHLSEFRSVLERFIAPKLLQAVYYGPSMRKLYGLRFVHFVLTPLIDAKVAVSCFKDGLLSQGGCPFGRLSLDKKLHRASATPSVNKLRTSPFSRQIGTGCQNFMTSISSQNTFLSHKWVDYLEKVDRAFEICWHFLSTSCTPLSRLPKHAWILLHPIGPSGHRSCSWYSARWTEQFASHLLVG